MIIIKILNNKFTCSAQTVLPAVANITRNGMLTARHSLIASHTQSRHYAHKGARSIEYSKSGYGTDVCVCVYSCSRNEVPRVAQRYGTIAAHTRRRASVLVMFVVFCVHMYSFAGLIRRTPPPTFSDTAITDRHSNTTMFQLRAHGGSRTLDFLRAR